MKPTILLLEDDAFEQDWLSKILEEEGYTVNLATNGDEIKKKINEDEGNIVMAVLDMKILGSNAAENFGEEIPNRRGVAAAKYIQQHLGAIPIIFASAFGKEGVKEIADVANYTGPWAYFDKDVLRDRQSTILREAVRLAIQSYDAYKEESAEQIETLQIRRRSGEFIFNFNVRNNDPLPEDPVFSRQLYKKEEIDCIRSLGGGVLRIFISDGSTFDVSMTPNQFRTQYESILNIYDEDDFFIEGISNGTSIWVNYTNVRLYNRSIARFRINEASINTALKQGLDRLFPGFGAG